MALIQSALAYSLFALRCCLTEWTMLFSVQRLHLETSLMANRYSSPLSPLRSPLQSPPQSPLQRFQLAVGSLFICTLIVALNGCSNAVESQQTLIENVNVVDPVNGLTQNQQVLIEDGAIAAVADVSQTLTLNVQRSVFMSLEPLCPVPNGLSVPQ